MSRQASEYNKVMSSLRTLDFTPSAIDSIWAMTAAILHLGNVDFFLDENDTAGIRNMDVVDKVLLGDNSFITLLDLGNIFKMSSPDIRSVGSVSQRAF